MGKLGKLTLNFEFHLNKAYFLCTLLAFTREYAKGEHCSQVVSATKTQYPHNNIQIFDSYWWNEVTMITLAVHFNRVIIVIISIN